MSASSNRTARDKAACVSALKTGSISDLEMASGRGDPVRARMRRDNAADEGLALKRPQFARLCGRHSAFKEFVESHADRAQTSSDLSGEAHCDLPR